MDTLYFVEMKKIRYYLITCIFLVLILLYAFRSRRAGQSESSVHTKLLTVPELNKLLAQSGNAGNIYTVKGILHGRERVGAVEFLILQSENTGLDSTRLYCEIRPEQEKAGRLLRPGNELVISGKMGSGNGKLLLAQATVISENILDPQEGQNSY